MAVPDYQSLMYPVLAELGDGQERLLRDVRDRVAARLQLTAHHVLFEAKA